MFFSVGQTNSVVNAFPGPKEHMKNSLVPSFHYLFYVFQNIGSIVMMLLCVLQVVVHVKRIQHGMSHTKRSIIQFGIFFVSFVVLSNTFHYAVAQITLLQGLEFFSATPGVSSLRSTHLAILVFEIFLFLTMSTQVVVSFIGALNNAKLGYEEHKTEAVVQPSVFYSGTSSGQQAGVRKAPGGPNRLEKNHEEDNDEYIEVPLGTK
mmetsp:Transcript_3753/g.14234  ORF Transcript_3753/g.14234 Transcript_3753/m.14234 type:complete len:206 (-) Transcript_3753:212-829(-)